MYGLALPLLMASLLMQQQAGQEAGSARCVIPDATELAIETADKVDSRSAKPEDKFGIRLARDLIVDGRILLAAGTPGSGEVIHSARSSGMGRPGELILAARFLDARGVRVRLRGFRINSVGRQTRGTITVVGTAIVPTLSGDDVEVPAGTVAIARTTEAIEIPCPAGN